MTGGWLLPSNSNQISDCTGGHKVMQFDTAGQNNLICDRRGHSLKSES